MQLFWSPTSPYVRKVDVLCHETGQFDAIERVPVSTTPLARNPETGAANPLGKIPCLVRENGPALFDSRVICQYLDTRHGGRRMYPEGVARFSTLTLEALADGVLDAVILCVYEARLRPEDKRFGAWVEGQKAKVSNALNSAETVWLAHLKGPLDMSHIALGCALGYVDLRMPEWDWRAECPSLAEWNAGFAARPSMAATVPVG